VDGRLEELVRPLVTECPLPVCELTTFCHSPLTMLASDGSQYTYKSDSYGRVAVRPCFSFLHLPSCVSILTSILSSLVVLGFTHLLVFLLRPLFTMLYIDGYLLIYHLSPSSTAPPTHPHLIPPHSPGTTTKAQTTPLVTPPTHISPSSRRWNTSEPKSLQACWSYKG
jgi:hypothetical protein